MSSLFENLEQWIFLKRQGIKQKRRDKKEDSPKSRTFKWENWDTTHIPSDHIVSHLIIHQDFCIKAFCTITISFMTIGYMYIFMNESLNNISSSKRSKKKNFKFVITFRCWSPCHYLRGYRKW